MLTIFFIYKKLFLHKNKIMKVFSIILIFTIVFIFYYIFRDLIEQLIIGLLLGIVLIYNGIYEFFTGKHVDLLTFAVMPTTSMIIKNFCFL